MTNGDCNFAFQHFPQREWLAVFPTIIGASHSHDYEFWHPYGNASDGLRKYAENGLTTALELELKSNVCIVITCIRCIVVVWKIE